MYYQLRHETRYRRLWEGCLHYAIRSAKNLKHQDCMNIIEEIRKAEDTTMTRYLADEYCDEELAAGLAQDKAEGILAFSQSPLWQIVEIDP